MLAMTPAHAQQDDTEQIKARQRISTMEGVLERAVSNGAESMLRQVRTVRADLPSLTGLPEARGFRLDGYGAFFDVEVPALILPPTWPLRLLYRDSTNRIVDELRAMMVTFDQRTREQLSPLVRRLELQSQGATGLVSASGQTSGQVVAQTSAQDNPQGVIDDPESRYTQEVKAALIDAMIENSQPLNIAPEEWLTVAARDNVPHDPLTPGDKTDFSTLIFRVKGTDLAAFRAGRMTIDEVRKKVEVREY
jgi:hypothetical protein